MQTQLIELDNIIKHTPAGRERRQLIARRLIMAHNWRKLREELELTNIDNRALWQPGRLNQ